MPTRFKRRLIFLTGFALSCLLISAISLNAARDGEKLFQKARAYEQQGHLETAIAAYDIVVTHYGNSSRAREAGNRIRALRQQIEQRKSARLNRLSQIQKPDLNQGRQVRTALEMGLSLTAAEEARLAGLTEDLMRSMGTSPTANLPRAKSSSSGVPCPVIEKVICPPVGQAGEPLFIKIVAKNIGAGARQGGITISFPDKPDYITICEGAGQSAKITLYEQGSRLYSGARGAYIQSTDPMIETYQWTAIPGNSRYFISTILIPDRSGVLRLFIRTALRGQGKNFYNYPSEGRLDQQSYHVLEYPIFVKD